MASIVDQVRYNNTNLTYYIGKIKLTNHGTKYTLLNDNETPRHEISEKSLLNNFTNDTRNHERKTRHLTPDNNRYTTRVKHGGRKTRRNKLKKKRRKSNRRR